MNTQDNYSRSQIIPLQTLKTREGAGVAGNNGVRDVGKHGKEMTDEAEVGDYMELGTIESVEIECDGAARKRRVSITRGAEMFVMAMLCIVLCIYIRNITLLVT